MSHCRASGRSGVELPGVPSLPRSILLLVLFCGLLVLPNLSASVVDRIQELRVLTPARTMAEGGSWLIPEFQHEPRLRKPPAMYWLVASAFALAGDTGSVFVARLPAFVNATLMLLVIGIGGSVLVGRRRALLAAVIAATSMVFLRHAMLAETDMPVSMLTALAILGIHRASLRPGAAAPWLLVGLWAGLGFMVKGPAAIGLPLLVYLAYGIVAPGRRRALWQWRALLALPVFAAVAAPWYLAVWFDPVGHAALRASIDGEIQNTFLEATHKKDLFYYFYKLPALMLPWGLLLPPALWLAWRHARRNRRHRFLAVWFAVTFATLTCTVQKQPHYVSLLIAPSSLLLAQFMALGRTSAQLWPARLGRGFWLGLVALLGIAGVVGIAAMPFVAGSSWTVLPVGAALAIAATVLVRRRRDVGWTTRMLLLPPLMAAATWLYVDLYDSRSDMDVALPRLFAAAAPRLPTAGQVFVLGPYDANLAWYAHRPVQYADDLPSAWAQAAPGDVLLVSSNDKTKVDRGSLPVPPEALIERGRLVLSLHVRR